MDSILDVLNKEQQEAVKAIEGPVMVFAGAGTGKTKTLTARVAYMVKEVGIKPWNILAITFTKKATNEMRERLYHFLDDDAKFLNISTIHSLCLRILRRHGNLIGIKKQFEVIDEDDANKVLNDVYKEMALDKRDLSIRFASKLISDYKNEVTPLNPRVKDIYEAYEAYLAKEGFLDFDDLLIKTKELLNTNKEALDYYQKIYKYILVDEFQDTNKAQHTIIKLLAGEAANLFVVGDDDQSIYSFRGANIANMLSFTKDYPNAKVVKLVQNYRSHDTILKGANSLIKNNTLREPKELYSLIPGSSKDVLVQEASYYEEEINFVTNEISHLVRSGVCDYKDIAVLYRNSAVSRNFEVSFINERIPYNIYGGFSYMKRREIKDIISYLRLVIDPNRIAHFRRVIILEERGIGEKTIQLVEKTMLEEGIDLPVAIEYIYQCNPSTKNRALLEFKEELDDLRNHLEKMTLTEFFDYLLEKTHFIERLEDEDYEDNTNRVDNVNEFRSVLYDMEVNINDEDLTNAERLRFGLDDILLDVNFEEKHIENAVTLSTIHSVKGLEFEVVFCVALEEGLFPSFKEDADIEEERRVAYVAFTRAKSKIYISCAQKRLIFGRMVNNRISRFIQEYLETSEETQVVKTNQIGASDVEIHVGSKINHKFFGYGKVIAIDDNFIQIIFEKDSSIKKIKRDYPYITVLS